MITWPERYGGRDATLPQWVVYEEEYFRAGAPVRASANGTSMLAPTLFAHGTEGAAGPRAAENGQRRGDLGAGMVGAGVRQ
jgi:alkylation response protein AidB-like acyl-CoA dehydrogenase